MLCNLSAKISIFLVFMNSYALTPNLVGSIVYLAIKN